MSYPNPLHAPGAQVVDHRPDRNEFKALMDKVVDQHGRTYAHCLAVSFRWEKDNTNAEKDTLNFQTILHTFGFNKATEFVIRAHDATPGWTVRREYEKMLEKAISNDQRTIIFIHYAGHGMHLDGELCFTADGHKMFAVTPTFFIDVDDEGSYLEFPSNVDVVFIFDACYSHLAARSRQARNRVVEVLAATSEVTPTAFPAKAHATFTGKLANEIAARKGRGDSDVEFAELAETLRANSPRKKPVHALRIGFNSIRLKFPGASTANHPSGGPALQAVFAFQISQDMTKAQVSEFVAWMRTLPPHVGLRLENLYRTESMCLVLRSAYSVYSKLIGLPFIQLICETKDANLLSQIESTPVQAPATTQKKKENVPPHAKR